MKKITFVVITLIAIATGCQAPERLQGPPGPQGPKGDTGIGIQGLTGEPGAPGENANPIDVEDGDGIRVGPFAGFADSRGDTTYVVAVVQGVKKLAMVRLADGAFEQADAYYTSSDCTGTPYLKKDDGKFRHLVFGIGPDLFQVANPYSKIHLTGAQVQRAIYSGSTACEAAMTYDDDYYEASVVQNAVVRFKGPLKIVSK